MISSLRLCRECLSTMLIGTAELLTWKFVAESTPPEKVEVENEGREVCAAFREALVASVIEIDDAVGEEGWEADVADGCIINDPTGEDAVGLELLGDCGELRSCKLYL